MTEIKKLLEKYTIEELAVKIGVSAKTLYRWKKDASRPHKIFQKKIEHILRMEQN